MFIGTLCVRRRQQRRRDDAEQRVAGVSGLAALWSFFDAGTTIIYTSGFWIAAFARGEQPLSGANLSWANQRHFLRLGLFTALNGVLFQFSALYVDGSLSQVLANLMILQLPLIECLWLPERRNDYRRPRNLVGLGVVVAGVALGCVSAFTGLGAPIDGGAWPAPQVDKWWWIALWSLSTTFNALQQVGQDVAFRDARAVIRPVTCLAWYNLYSIPAYLFVIPFEALAVVNGQPGGTSLLDAFTGQWAAFRCFFGVPYAADVAAGNCQPPLSTVWPLVFCAGYVGMFAFNAIIIEQYGVLFPNILTSFVSMAAAAVFYWPAIVGEHVVPFTPWPLVGCAVLAVGLVLRGMPDSKKGDDESEDLSTPVSVVDGDIAMTSPTKTWAAAAAASAHTSPSLQLRRSPTASPTKAASSPRPSLTGKSTSPLRAAASASGSSPLVASAASPGAHRNSSAVPAAPSPERTRIGADVIVADDGLETIVVSYVEVVLRQVPTGTERWQIVNVFRKFAGFDDEAMTYFDSRRLAVLPFDTEEHAAPARQYHNLAECGTARDTGHRLFVEQCHAFKPADRPFVFYQLFIPGVPGAVDDDDLRAALTKLTGTRPDALTVHRPNGNHTPGYAFVAYVERQPYVTAYNANYVVVSGRPLDIHDGLGNAKRSDVHILYVGGFTDVRLTFGVKVIEQIVKSRFGNFPRDRYVAGKMRRNEKTNRHLGHGFIMVVGHEVRDHLIGLGEFTARISDAQYGIVEQKLHFALPRSKVNSKRRERNFTKLYNSAPGTAASSSLSSDSSSASSSAPPPPRSDRTANPPAPAQRRQPTNGSDYARAGVGLRQPTASK